MKIVARFKKLFENYRAEEYDPPSELHWIPASENPFGLDILDCRSITQGMLSTTSDVKVAMTFDKLRSAQGLNARLSRRRVKRQAGL